MPAESRVTDLRRYVELDEGAAASVARLRPFAAPHFDRIAREFYDRLREHEDAHAVFRDEEQIVRQRRALIAWLHRLLGGVYDEAYFAQTAAIGRVHVRLGVPPRYVFTAMSHVRGALQRIAREALGADSTTVEDALGKLLDVELAVMHDAYEEAILARARRRADLDARGLTGKPGVDPCAQAVEVARMIVAGLDAEGKIRLFNHEAEVITGYAREDVLGSSFAEVLLAERQTSAEAALDAALAGKISHDSVEVVLRTRAGHYRDVHCHLTRVPGGAGAPIVFLFAQDVTTDKADAEQRRHQEKLAAVGTLAAGLAHEIRNPLNGAQLHVAYLERSIKRGGSQVEMLDAVRVVADEIKRLARLVTEFLDFARPQPLVVEATPLAAVCHRVVQLASESAAAQGVRVVADVPARDVKVEADKAKLEQVLLNLVQNAVEALATAGGGNVTVRTRRTPKAAVLEVEDDGPGLESPDAPIFDAFYSTKPNGTGLGLAIALRIVSDHGGALTFESRPGRTVFRATLPFAIAKLAASATEDQKTVT